jgi:TRAP-type C4-dicarboxylate transport system substrate-binding protein
VVLFRFCFCLMILVIAPATVDAKENLTAITFAQRDSVWVKNFQLFTDAVTERSKGQIKFRYAGGPEAIPPFEQIEAIKKGVVQVALLPAAYFVPQLPEADAMKLSPYLPGQERNNGLYRYFNQLMQERLGVYYLGRLSSGIGYHFYLKKTLTGTDLSGLRIRVTPIYEPFVRALRGTPVTMAPSEVYVALQRGVIDGLGWPSVGLLDLGWQEVVKYVVEPGFYQTDVCVLVNLLTWRKMSAATRELLRKTMEAVEEESRKLSAADANQERRTLEVGGLKVIQIGKGEAEQAYLRLADRSAWDRILVKCPKTGPILQKLMEPNDGESF